MITARRSAIDSLNPQWSLNQRPSNCFMAAAISSWEPRRVEQRYVLLASIGPPQWSHRASFVFQEAASNDAHQAEPWKRPMATISANKNIISHIGQLMHLVCRFLSFSDFSTLISCEALGGSLSCEALGAPEARGAPVPR